MNSKKSYGKKVIAIILAVAMVASMSIMSVFANSAVNDSGAAKASNAMMPLAAKTATSTPSITIDYVNEKLTGFAATGHSVTVDGSTTEISTPNNECAIDNSWFGKTINVLVTDWATASTDVVIKARQAAPTVAGGAGKITGTTTLMEYATSAAPTTWNACAAPETIVAAGTYSVRVKATTSEFKSTATTVTVTAGSTGETVPTSITLSAVGLIGRVGTTGDLIATVLPKTATQTVIWTSSNPDVVKVENGQITALKSGTSVITASTVNDLTAKCTITVVDDRELIKAYDSFFNEIKSYEAENGEIMVSDLAPSRIKKGVHYIPEAIYNETVEILGKIETAMGDVQSTQEEMDALTKALITFNTKYFDSIRIGTYVSSGGSSSGGSSGGSSSVTPPTTTTKPDGSVSVVAPDTTVTGNKAEVKIPDIDITAGTTSKPVEVTINVPVTSVTDMIKDSSESTVEVSIVIPKAISGASNAVIKDINLDLDIIKQAKESGKVVAVKIANEDGKVLATWEFDGKAITNVLDVNLSLSIKNSSAVPAIATAFGNAKATVISFNHSGVLPGTATVKLNVSEQFSANDVLDLYYNNGGKLELVSKGIAVDASGIAAVKINHCSDYVLVKTGTVANTTGGNIVTNNPQTGDSNPLLPMMVLALAAAMGLVGTSIVLKRKAN